MLGDNRSAIHFEFSTPRDRVRQQIRRIRRNGAMVRGIVVLVIIAVPAALLYGL
jgi:hypothetical protein